MGGEGGKDCCKVVRIEKEDKRLGMVGGNTGGNKIHFHWSSRKVKLVMRYMSAAEHKN